jgi:hypothetical protein
MSEKDHPRQGKPIEPEVVREDGSEAPRPGGLRRVERQALDRPVTTTLGSVLESLFHSPKREARQAREWADAADAHTELNEALGDLAASQAKLRDLPTIIATDNERRQTELTHAQSERIRAQNEKAEAERIARLQKLKDERAEEEARAELAEARRRREQAEKPAPPPDEDGRRREAVARKFRERMGRQFTEQEVRAYAAQGIAEIKARAGGEVTPAIQREIDNVTDVMNSLLDEL